MFFRKEVYDLDDGDFLGIGLSSRKNLCIHPQVRHEKKGKAVDARCRDMTNSVAKEKWTQDPESIELCSFHEVRFSFLSLSTMFVDNEGKLMRECVGGKGRIWENWIRII